jgi:ferric-chelate reductase [NAD(P)H]
MNGQIVNTVIQVTSDPPRVAVIINKKNLTHDFISKSRVFGVTVLDEATPMKFLGPFGFRSGRDMNKFSEVQFTEGVTGCPLVTEHAVSLLEAEVFDQIDLGTHTIFVGNAVNSEVVHPNSSDPQSPLFPSHSEESFGRLWINSTTSPDIS